jgi:hypothetical protein
MAPSIVKVSFDGFVNKLGTILNQMLLQSLLLSGKRNDFKGIVDLVKK